MNRALRRIALLTTAALLFLVGGSSAASAGNAETGVDDFEFASFHAEYHLDRDEAGHSTLLTRETLIARFPDHDQNRGIRRAIPNHYRDISTRLEVVSVTDEAGLSRSFAVDTDGDFDVITIAVPQGQYVHGTQTYVIEYVQRDVTAFFPDTGRDEFYWDANGTGWRQAFHQVSVELHIARELADALTGDTACYQGAAGSTEPCAIERRDDAESGSGATYVATSAAGLGPHENLTVAVGFSPGTFAEAEPADIVHRFAHWIAAMPIAFALLLAVACLALSRSAWRDAPRRRAVIAQYEPLQDIDVFLAADILGTQTKAAVASLLDLAVRGNTRLLQHEVPLERYPGLSVGAVRRTRGASARRMPIFGVQALADTGLTPAERSFAAMLFPPRFAPEAVRWFDRDDGMLAERIVAWRSTTARRAMALGLRRRPAVSSHIVVVLLAVLTAVSQAVALYALIERVERDMLILSPALLGFTGTTAVVILVIFALRRRPLTPEGREILDHLQGVRLFVQLAEVDRLRMLQSWRGAERISAAAAVGGPKGADAAATFAVAEARVSIIHVYERLLPYAVLFGFERTWLATLANHYQEARPGWMIFGRHDTPLPAFVDSLSGFVSSMSTSYSGSDRSSNSGGSHGGGSSGGGGGGGGGGGV